LQTLVTPKRTQGIGHQQQLEGNKTTHHPKAHRAHEKQESKGNDGDPPKAGGNGSHVRPAVHVAVLFAVPDGGDLKNPVVRSGGCQAEQCANACERLADREPDHESEDG